MPHLRRHLIQRGAELQRAFVTTPVCCPSRSSMLTGQYSHNHQVLTNNENCTSALWRQRHEPLTFGKQLNDAGYRTAYVGKYLNRYDGSYIPSGWDRWVGQIKNTKFYNYSLNEDGLVTWHGANYSEDYFTDVVTNRSLEILNDWASETDDHQPFLLVLSYPAPHGPEDSAPRHQSLFANDRRHRTASYNRAPSPDKEWLLRRAEPMSPLHRRFTDALQRKRLQTLQSVDDDVRRLADWLDSDSGPGIGNNTFVFYTSDHGYHLGQFGLLKGKATPYEFDIRVPLVVRGPGVRPGRVVRQPVLNIDLAPTLLDLAGVAPVRPMDGASYAGLLLSAGAGSERVNITQWRRSFLVERGRMTVRKLSLQREIEAAKNFEQKDAQVCSHRDIRSLSCSLGDRFHCVASGQPDGQHQRVRCPSSNPDASIGAARTCRCRRSVVLPLSEHVWKHCWRQTRSRRSAERDESDDSQTSFANVDDDETDEDSLDNSTGADDSDDSEDIQCQYSSLAEWLRDRRMMRLTQRKLDDIQVKLNRMRLAMRRNKATLMRLRGGCGCSRGSPLTVSLLDDDRRRRLGDLLPRGRPTGRRNRRAKRRRKQSECNLRFMNCFFHDRSHWKTPPLWTDASICFCGNANNYTYWCLRSVDGPDESLYCEFVTGFISYYNMTSDPHQLVNKAAELSFERRTELHAALNRLRACSGPACTAAGQF